MSAGWDYAFLEQRQAGQLPNAFFPSRAGRAALAIAGLVFSGTALTRLSQPFLHRLFPSHSLLPHHSPVFSDFPSTNGHLPLPSNLAGGTSDLSFSSLQLDLGEISPETPSSAIFAPDMEESRHIYPIRATDLENQIYIAEGEKKDLLGPPTGRPVRASNIPFVPRNGVDDAVLMRPGPTGGLQLLPIDPKQAYAWSCVFLYTNKPGDALKAHVEPGVIYGAKLIEEELVQGVPKHSGTAIPLPSHAKRHLAKVTGKADDLIKGRLLCWSQKDFPGFKAIDKLQEYELNKPSNLYVRRGVCKVVREDGSSKAAFFYYVDYPVIKENITHFTPNGTVPIPKKQKAKEPSEPTTAMADQTPPVPTKTEKAATSAPSTTKTAASTTRTDKEKTTTWTSTAATAAKITGVADATKPPQTTTTTAEATQVVALVSQPKAELFKIPEKFDSGQLDLSNPLWGVWAADKIWLKCLLPMAQKTTTITMLIVR
eukprot:g45892.t1